MSDPSLRDLLHRAARPEALPGDLAVDDVPPEPLALFRAWLADAVDAGVVQPQAMVLSTTSTRGGPDARVVLLKDLDDAFSFSTSALSPKGRDLEADPRVSLTFAWSSRGRQVRVRGTVEPGGRGRAEEDFRARHPETRVAAMVERQSDPVPPPEEVEARADRLRRRLDDDPDLVPEDWRVFRVVPSSVEFWQGSTGRDQARVRYDRVDDGWSRAQLWP